MRTSQTILGVALILALLAAGSAGAWCYRERQWNDELREMAQGQAREAGLVQAQFERNVLSLENRIENLKGDLNAARVRGAARETEIAALQTKFEALQKQLEQTKIQYQYANYLSRLPHYETAEQILALPACVLMDAQNQTCMEGFTDRAGNPFTIGGPGASEEVAEFINGLEDGKTYVFPAAFIEFQKKRKLAAPGEKEAGKGF